MDLAIIDIIQATLNMMIMSVMLSNVDLCIILSLAVPLMR